MRKVKWVAILLLSVSAYVLVPKLIYVPIRTVSVPDKLQHVDLQAVKEVVSKHLGEGFFNLKMSKINRELKRIPWVANAKLERHWPDTLKIKIIERQALAIWNDKGIIDTEGKLFFPGKNIATLEAVAFRGPQHSIDEMFATYTQVLTALKPLGLAIKELVLLPDQGWTLKLDNDIILILGQKELAERLERFVAFYSVEHAGHASRVDLRYTNGLSVVWGNSEKKG